VWIQNIKVHTAPRYPQVREVPQVRPATEALVGRHHHHHHHHHHQNQCQCSVGSVGAICIIIFWWWWWVLVLWLWLLMLLVILLLLLVLLLNFPRKPPALPTKRLITTASHRVVAFFATATRHGILLECARKEQQQEQTLGGANHNSGRRHATQPHEAAVLRCSGAGPADKTSPHRHQHLLALAPELAPELPPELPPELM